MFELLKYVEHVCMYVNLMHETISLVTLHLHRLPNASLLWSKTCINLDNYVIELRGVGDGWAEWTIAHPGFGTIERGGAPHYYFPIQF